MDIFNVLEMIGGMCLFLFGMNLLGQALERKAGSKLKGVLAKMTTSKPAGFLTGLGVTAVIQSSSATTVMVVGFVNAGIMTLAQAVNVIMGANVGTTITGWILSLGGISGDSLVVQLLKPTSFTPILALVGIILYMFIKKQQKKDTGLIFLGFAILMFGMATMTNAVSVLGDLPGFRQLFIMFQNPLLGLLAGALLTAIIQSSSASVGILQALAMTGAVSYGAAIPIVMGDAIGTCVTAVISSIGAKKDAKRAAMVHLLFNIIGALFWLIIYSIIRAIFNPLILNQSATILGIAIVNTAFKVLSTLLLLPLSKVLEILARKIIPDAKEKEEITKLDERLLASPMIALNQSHIVTMEMAKMTRESISMAITSITDYSSDRAEIIREKEDKCDAYEDMLVKYLIKIGSSNLREKESERTTLLLKMVTDFERISDHALNILESAEEIVNGKLSLSDDAKKELTVLSSAINRVVGLAFKAFEDDDLASARLVEPLEEVIDLLKEQLRTNHLKRIQEGKCVPEMSFIWSDIITDLERVSDHCSNIAAGLLTNSPHDLKNKIKNDKFFETQYKAFYEEYKIV